MRHAGPSRRWAAASAAVALTAAVFASVGASAAQANAFIPAPGSPYATGNEPRNAYPGNFNGDALPDLATVNGTSTDVNLFDQQPGGGGFAAATGSPFLVGGGPSYGAVADFNNDGRQDIAVAQFDSASVTLMAQQPNGTLAAEGGAIGVGGRASAIAGGDFNADGKPDIAVADWDNGQVKTFVRKADNSGFMAGTTISTGGTNPRYIAVGDLDGASGPDLAVSNAGSGKVTALLNQPGGGFAQASGSPYTVGSQPQFVVIAPLDGDALPDLAVANYGDDNVTVLDRQANGSFAPASGSPFAVGDQPVGVAAADFRESGHMDLAVADSGTTSAVTLLENSGTTFTRGADIPVAPGVAPQGVSTGQFNDGDSLPDLAVTSVGNSGAAGDPDRLSVFINQPPPRATTLDATDLTGAGATLNATVNPRGSDTDAHFEYGTSEAYGSVAPAGGEIPAGADRTDHSISRSIDGLAPATTYHFRVVTSNAGGSSAGSDKTFTTAPTPPPPSTPGGPPQAYLSAPSEVTVGSRTTLSGEGSTPATGLTYALDLDGSGSYATDLGPVRNLETTFTTPGDVKVGLRVTDAIGRTDTVRRTVHVTAPQVFGLTITPRNPDPGDKVRFTLRQVVDDATKPSGTRLTPLSRDTLSTITYGDGKRLTGTAGPFRVPGREASMDGSFTHVFDQRGSFKLHVGVDDLDGFRQGVDLLLRVGRDTDYAPAITTSATTVDQGTCVSFKNGTFSRLSVNNLGPVQDEDINPKNQLVIVKPDTKVIILDGQPKFDQPVSFTTIASIPALGGSPYAHIPFSDIGAFQVSPRNLAQRRRAEAEPSETADPRVVCQQWSDLESGLASVTKPPYPKGADKGWPEVKECKNPEGLKRTTYSTDVVPGSVTPVLRKTQTTRYTWFSINRWDFGDGDKSGPEAYLPSYEAYHAYVKPGNFTVKLSTTFPKDLDGQLAAWNAACATNPLNASKNDSRFDTRTAEVKLHVRAHYDRIKSRGLWMTTGAKYFEETDLPDVYSTSGAVYINTRRRGVRTPPGLLGVPDFTEDLDDADGVLVVIPTGGPLLVAPDQGAIVGAARLEWQSGGGKRLALGPMPFNIKGTPGLVIPEAGPGGTHDFGVFTDPPAVLGGGDKVPDPGAAFHVNSAHPVLREGKNGEGGGGGTIEINFHLPPPLGPNGAGTDTTVSRSVNGRGRIVGDSSAHQRGIFDNIDVSIPAIELVPGVISFDGGRLTHHPTDKPPWQATGGLTVFDTKVSMSPDSKKPGCPVTGGLGFEDSGKLDHAGAVLDGLEIPLPNPPAPNPITALANPAFEIDPATPDRPLDLFGCLSLRDYPAHDTFTVTGCIGFLSGGVRGVSIPNGEPIHLCPDELGGENFALTDQNSIPDPNRPGRRILRGIVVRGSGTLGLGPKPFNVANAYLEYRNTGDTSTVEAKAHIGLDIIKDDLSIYGDVFGRFRSLTDWDIGGEGGVKQDIFCVPFTDFCPSPSAALLIAYRGFGVCATAYGAVGVGGTITFADLGIHAHFPGCTLKDLKDDLGVPGRRLPRYDDLLYRPRDPLLALGGAQSTGIQMKGGTPYSVIVVNGTDESPVVQVRDPDGKLVIDDNGQAVQGLKKAPAPPKAVDLASETPPPARTVPVKDQQGLFHNDLSNYHDANVDLRHATLIQIRKPKKGRYTITTKDGSSPITAISHADAFATPQVRAVVRRRGNRRMLALKSTLPLGSAMTVAEEGRDLSHRITSVAAAKASSATPAVTAARVNKRVRFRPALGDGGKRKLIAVISRDGIPQERMVVGSYRAPAPPKVGRVHKLRAKLRGSKLTVTWKRAKNALRYVVSVKLRKGATVTRSVGPKAHRLVLREALARKGATVTVRAIGPLATAGKPVKRRVKPVKVKRPKHYVL